MSNNRFLKFDEFDLDKDKNLEFSGVGYSGGVVKDPWSDDMIIVDVESVNFSKNSTDNDNKVPILWGHNHLEPAGHGYVSKENGKLVIKQGKLYGDRGKQLHEMMKNDFPMEMSIGFYNNPKDEVELKSGATMSINEHEVTAPVRVLYNARIREISLVSLGADENASARVFSAVANYKPEKEKNKMKKFKKFEECNCDEKKERIEMIDSKLAEVSDDKLAEAMAMIKDLMEAIQGMMTKSEEMENEVAKAVDEATDLKSNNEKLLQENEVLQKNINSKIEAEKKEKIEKSFSATQRELTSTVLDVYMSMSDKQLEVSLEAMVSDKKEYLFKEQKAGKADSGEKIDINTITSKARELRLKNPSLSIPESHNLARKEIQGA